MIQLKKGNWTIASKAQENKKKKLIPIKVEITMLFHYKNTIE